MIRMFNVGSKINFVDNENAFVGFDCDQQCCESFGWALIMDRNERLLATGEKNFSDADLVFDTSVEPCPQDELLKRVLLDSDYYMGGTMAFRVRDEYDFTDKGWLILYNCHNGFYSHGWEFGKLNVEKEGRI